MKGISVLQDTSNQPYVQVEQTFDDSILLFIEIRDHHSNTDRFAPNHEMKNCMKRYYKKGDIWSTVFNTAQEPYMLYQAVDSYKQVIDTKNEKRVEYKLNADFASKKMHLVHLLIQDSTGWQQYGMFSDSVLLQPFTYENIESIKKFATYSRTL